MKKFLGLLTFSLLFAAVESTAFQLSPFFATLSPKGRGRTTTFLVKNTKKHKVAVKIFITSRDIDEKGKELTPPLENKKLFNVYPKQVILAPGKSKKVRVTWRGSKNIKEEKAFRLFAKQLPIKGLHTGIKNKVGSIEVILQFIASIYVNPEGTFANIAAKDGKVVSIESGTNEKDKKKKEKKLGFYIQNSGTAHRVLGFSELLVKFEDDRGRPVEKKFNKDDLKMVYETNLLPGKRRYFELPWTHDEPKGTDQSNSIECKRVIAHHEKLPLGFTHRSSHEFSDSWSGRTH